MGIITFLSNVVLGERWDSVYPKRSPPETPPQDGRTVALSLLAEYITKLEFYRPGGLNEAPIKFVVDSRNIYVEWPDNEQWAEPSNFPAVTLLPSGRIKYEAINLTPTMIEDSEDKYGAGTALVLQNDHIETIVVEIMTPNRPERRALKSGLEIAFSPSEDVYGLRLLMRRYFDRIVMFTLTEGEVIDDENAVRNRRRLRIYLEMRHNVVQLVNRETLVPMVGVSVGGDVVV